MESSLVNLPFLLQKELGVILLPYSVLRKLKNGKTENFLSISDYEDWEI